MSPRFPGITVGVQIAPPFRKLTNEEDQEIIQRINDSGTRILFVSLGCPKQEYWIAEHRGKIHAVMVGVGAAFAFHAGEVRQSPSWMQKLGIEWLYRLISRTKAALEKVLVYHPTLYPPHHRRVSARKVIYQVWVAMLRRFSINFTIFSMILDGIMVLGSLVSMSSVRIAMNKLPFIETLPADIHYPLSIYLFFPVIWVGVLAAFSIYDGKKFFKLVDEFSMLTIASMVGSISQAGYLYLSYRDFSRALFLMIVVVTFVLCISWRLVARLIFRLRKDTLNLSRNLLIVGVGSELTKVEKEIRTNLLEEVLKVQILDLKTLE